MAYGYGAADSRTSGVRINLEPSNCGFSGFRGWLRVWGFRVFSPRSPPESTTLDSRFFRTSSSHREMPQLRRLVEGF